LAFKTFFPKVFVRRAVKCVAARLGGDVHHPARIIAVLGRNVVGYDAEFVDRVLGRDVRGDVVGRRVRGDPVREELALISETAANGIVAEPDRIRPGSARLFDTALP
jgi:hypothetical protein